MDDVRIYNYARSAAQIAVDAGVEEEETDSSLVAYWNFEENSVDGSDNGNDATLYGDCRYETDKAVGNYSLFLAGGGAEYAEVADSSSLDITGAFTVQMWVKPDTHSGGDVYLVSKGANAYGLMLQANASGDSYDVVFYSGLEQLDSSSPVSANQWSHIAAVYDGDYAIKIYINGSEVRSMTHPTAYPPSVNSTNLVIGKSTLNLNYYRGYIDDVRIYNDIRTIQEIAQDVAAGPGAGASQPGRVKIGNNVIRRGSGAETVIRTKVSDPGSVQVTIYDISGRVIREWRQELNMGNNPTDSFKWNGTDGGGGFLPHGVYCIRIEGMGLDSIKYVVIR